MLDIWRFRKKSKILSLNYSNIALIFVQFKGHFQISMVGHTHFISPVQILAIFYLI